MRNIEINKSHSIDQKFTKNYSNFKRHIEQDHFLKVLIVEDDLNLIPIWQHSVNLTHKDIRIDWATSYEVAENKIRLNYRRGCPYDLVIADINLSGTQTGIDLWNRVGEEVLRFVFVTGMSMSVFEFYKSLNYGAPSFFKKPLNVKLCMEIIDCVERNFKKGGIYEHQHRL